MFSEFAKVYYKKQTFIDIPIMAYTLTLYCAKAVSKEALLRNVPYLHRYMSSVEVGNRISRSRCFTQTEVDHFSQLSGDTNPIHSASDFPEGAAFSRPLVHGAFINAFVSGLLGTQLPGPGSVAFSQNIRFPNPLYVNEVVEAEVVISAISWKKLQSYVIIHFNPTLENQSC